MSFLSEHLEHTILKQGLTEYNISNNFEVCTAYDIPTIVIPPSFVKYASTLNTDASVSICSVIGFPLGYNTLKTKLFEINDAIFNGADEIDLVIDNSLVKDGGWTRLGNELSDYRKVCEGRILKIIVETSLLTRNELDRVAQTLIDNGIDYIKTSTGLVGDGAKLDDIKFLKDYFGGMIKIKASGGIKTKEQAVAFIKAGADRIGTSSAKQMLEN
jgi:deoxyribose-phosphate aldolase